MASKTTYLALAAVLATGVIAYAAYFDYKRRNDAEFRRKLKKERKRVHKNVEESKKAEESSATVDADVLREALKALKTEAPVPMEDREQYFMSQISMGEQLAAQGPEFYVPAAIAFFRALRIYPAPAELIGIYQSTVHPPVFKLVIEMTNMDVSSTSSPAAGTGASIDDSLDDVTERVRGYYDVFPPKSMNVQIVPHDSKSMVGARQAVVVTKDIAAGEVIYKEYPVVAALDQDLQLAGTHCTHCFRVIEAGKAIRSDDTSRVLPSAYCSEACLAVSKQQSQSILFTLENPLPDALMAGTAPADMTEQRKEAQTAFVEGHKRELRNVPMLTARFVARQVAAETKKLLAATALSTPDSTNKLGDFTDAESGDYTLADHTERFRYTEITPPEHDLKLLTAVLSTTLPGLEEFTTAERHAAMEAKMLYNAYGVCFDGGRDDKPAPARPEDLERTRTPYGTVRQIGSALYTLSSYLTHSCNPSARISFENGTTELSVIANRPLKKGDVVTVAFVDVTQHPGESVAEARRRRRFELARGWKFACGCERCAEENVAGADEGKDEELHVADEGKVDEAVRNYELNLPRRHDPEPEAAEEKIQEKLEEAIQDKVNEKVEEKLQDAAEVVTSEETVSPAVVEAAVESAAEEAVHEAVQETIQETIEEAIAASAEDVFEEVGTAQAAEETAEESQDAAAEIHEARAEEKQAVDELKEQIRDEEEQITEAIKAEVAEVKDEIHAEQEHAVEEIKEEIHAEEGHAVQEIKEEIQASQEKIVEEVEEAIEELQDAFSTPSDSFPDEPILDQVQAPAPEQH